VDPSSLDCFDASPTLHDLEGLSDSALRRRLVFLLLEHGAKLAWTTHAGRPRSVFKIEQVIANTGVSSDIVAFIRSQKERQTGRR
jgi:hypothetical protein